MITLLKMLNTNRVIRSLSHDAVEPSKQNVIAPVDHFCSVGCNDLSPCVLPMQAAFSLPVKAVLSLSYVPKICNSVVRSIVIDVVNHLRLLPINEKPSKPMTLVFAVLERNASVAGTHWRASNTANFDSAGLFVGLGNPAKNSGFGIVAKEIADRFWNNLASHFESPLNLVRGLTAPTVSTPILSWRAAL